MGVTHLDLDVPDLHRAGRLFGALLGGQPVEGSASSLLRRADGGAGIRLAEVPGGRARLRRITLDLPDRDAAVARLRGAGGRDDRGRSERGRGGAGHEVEDVDGQGVLVHAAGLGVELLLPPDGGHLTTAGAPDPPTTSGTAGTTAFDHVCLAVPSLADAVHLLRDLLGGDVVFGGHNRELGTLSSQVAFGGGTRVELLQPVRPDAAIAGYLDRRGPGLHHMTWHVTDVEVAVAAATALDLEVTGTDLTSRVHWRETYLRPSSAMGLLLQLSWTDAHHVQPLDDGAVAAILAGEVDSHGYTMRPG